MARGGYVSIWATGQGLVNPAGVDGEAITAAKNIQAPVKVTIGGIDAQVLGAVLIYTGEIQVNVDDPERRSHRQCAAGHLDAVGTHDATAARKDATIADLRYDLRLARSLVLLRP